MGRGLVPQRPDLARPNACSGGRSQGGGGVSPFYAEMISRCLSRTERSRIYSCLSPYAQPAAPYESSLAAAAKKRQHFFLPYMSLIFFWGGRDQIDLIKGVKSYFDAKKSAVFSPCLQNLKLSYYRRQKSPPCNYIHISAFRLPTFSSPSANHLPDSELWQATATH